jgi:hypothetical protein
VLHLCNMQLHMQLKVFNYNSLLKSILEMYIYKEMSDQTHWLVKMYIGNQRLIYVMQVANNHVTNSL